MIIRKVDSIDDIVCVIITINISQISVFLLKLKLYHYEK